MISRCLTPQKSAKYGPIGWLRRNLNPPNRLARRIRHSSRSWSVDSVRSLRPRSRELSSSDIAIARLRRRADKGPSLGAPKRGAGLPLIGGDAQEVRTGKIGNRIYRQHG